MQHDLIAQGLVIISHQQQLHLNKAIRKMKLQAAKIASIANMPQDMDASTGIIILCSMPHPRQISFPYWSAQWNWENLSILC